MASITWLQVSVYKRKLQLKFQAKKSINTSDFGELAMFGSAHSEVFWSCRAGQISCAWVLLFFGQKKKKNTATKRSLFTRPEINSSTNRCCYSADDLPESQRGGRSVPGREISIVAKFSTCRLFWGESVKMALWWFSCVPPVKSSPRPIDGSTVNGRWAWAKRRSGVRQFSSD